MRSSAYLALICSISMVGEPSFGWQAKDHEDSNMCEASNIFTGLLNSVCFFLVKPWLYVKACADQTEIHHGMT